jgi:cytochrome c oxidase accessory protein FixG
VFRPLESLLEGRAVRRRRARLQPLRSSLLLRRLVKLGLYVVVASALAHTFVAYFVGTDALLQMIQHSPRQSWGSFVAMAVVTGMILLDFAWVRELTCVIACPYGRLQSLLIDARSWIVGYDATRGEPRRRLVARRGQAGGVGDCIDCGSCHRTCPTGIDIREGLQLECIGCTQCIDACDQVMDRTGRPRGLIRYTSLDQLRGVTTSFWRPRVFLYAGIVLAAGAVLALLVATRHTFESDLVRVTGAPFYVQSDGEVCNRIRLRLTNRLPSEGRFQITLVEPSEGELILGQLPLELDPLQVRAVEGIIRVPPGAMSDGSRLARIRVEAAEGSTRDHVFKLLGPQGGQK